MNNIFKRTLSLLLVLVMCISLVPASAFAVETEENSEPTEMVEQLPEEQIAEQNEATEPATEEEKEPVFIPVESITITAEKTELEVGDTMQLTATVLPEDATNKEVTWSSSDESVLIVDEFGVVISVSEGSAKISVHATDGSVITSSLDIKVSGIETNDSQLTFNTSDSTILYSGTCGENLTWTLDADGLLNISGSGAMYGYSASYNSSAGRYITRAPWGSYYASVNTVEIDFGVTSIGNNAFYGCSLLTSIIIPTGVMSIGNHAFFGCSLLTSIAIPNSVTSISELAFYGCSSLTSIAIPDSVTSIDYSAFSGCSLLASVTIGNSVTSIAYSAFDNCTSLTSITVSLENVVYSSDDGVLLNKEKTELIYCPDGKDSVYVVPNSVTSIGNAAFKSCSLLTNITIPNSVTSVGSHAFDGCSGLSSIVIPNGVTSIKEYTFRNCTGLTEILLPESLASIGEYALYGCIGLKRVELPDNVSYIGKCAFYGCANLDTINYPMNWNEPSWDNPNFYADIFSECPKLKTVTIPEGVTEIVDFAFSGCTSITSISLPSTVHSIGKYAFYGCSGINTISIPAGVDRIEEGTFYECTSLSSVVIPTGIKEIGNKAFYQCSSLTDVEIPAGVEIIGYSAFNNCGELSSIIIPEGVLKIGKLAFYECSELKSISLPKSLNFSGVGAFAFCNKLEKVYYMGDVDDWLNIEFEISTYWTCLYYSNPMSYADKIYIHGTEEVQGITLPESVTYIGEYSFLNWKDLEWIVIPDTVSVIGRYAFSGSGLKTLTLPETISDIGEGAFSGCSITSVTYEGNLPLWMNINFEDLYANPMHKGSNITIDGEIIASLIIPEGINIIKPNVFSGDCNLTDIIIPDSVTEVSGYAFYNCKALSSVSIGNNVCKIGNHAFDNCTSLTSVVIPNVTYSYIGDYAFYSCSSLTSVIIPDVEDIGDYAFYGCSSLRSVTYGLAHFSSTSFQGETVADVYYRGTLEQISSFWTDEFPNATFHTSGIASGKIDCPDSFPDYCSWSIDSSGKLWVSGSINGYTPDNSPPWMQYADQITGIDISDTFNAYKTVGSYAFSGLENVKTVAIRCNISSIGSAAFSGCTSLTDIYYDKIQSEWNSIVIESGNDAVVTSSIHYDYLHIYEDIYYSGKCGDNLNWKIDGNGVLSIYTVPTVRGDFAMDYASFEDEWFTQYKDEVYDVKEIVVETGVKYIEGFDSFEILESVVLPDTLIEIGEGCFSSCKTLKEIDIKDGVKKIGESAFSLCYGIEKLILPEGLEVIEKDLLYWCDGLKELTIPASVRVIKNFYDWNFTRSINTINFSGTLHDWMQIEFYGRLHSNIVGYADKLYIDGIDVTKLTNVTIPDGISEIKEHTFWGWDMVKALLIPDLVTTIRSNAFYGLDNLSDITFEHSSINSLLIEEGAFSISKRNYVVQTSIKVQDTYNINPSISGYDWADSQREVYYKNIDEPKTITITSQPQSCTVEEGNTVALTVEAEYSGEGELSYLWKCYNIYTQQWEDANEFATSYTESLFIVDDVSTFLNDYRFKCVITAPNGSSVETNEVTVSVTPADPAVPHSGTCGDNLTWTLDEYGLLTISGIGDMYDYSYGTVPWFGLSDSCGVKSVVLSDGVTSIGNYAFFNCYSLTDVDIPESVTSIGYCVFDYCYDLMEIAVHSDNSYYSSLDGVLYDKAQSTLICCPGGKAGKYIVPNSVTSICDSAFVCCSRLTSIDIPDSVTSIGDCVFEYCSSLTEIAVHSDNSYYSSLDGVLFDKTQSTLICYPGGKAGEYIVPDTVTSISDFAFIDCSSLTDVDIPDSVTSIGIFAFFNCSSLSDIDIPNSMTSISDYTFYYCSSLTSITIPSSVTSIGNAFVGCSSLKDVYYAGNEAQWNSITVASGNECLTNATIHYNSIIVTFGDVNMDGEVNILDVSLLRRAAAGLVELSDDQKAVSDIYIDGKYNSLDVNLLRRYVAGLVTQIPIDTNQ